ncbi:hypothetical protein C8R45DRAFT_1077171 [Mycena sanguinolenta]|nr:hypothetical protein C8R45DRAFT_1077171 [Mycena sanguinolenta]
MRKRSGSMYRDDKEDRYRWKEKSARARWIFFSSGREPEEEVRPAEVVPGWHPVPGEGRVPTMAGRWYYTNQAPVSGAREAHKYEAVPDIRGDPGWQVLPAEFSRRLYFLQPGTCGSEECDEIRVCVPHHKFFTHQNGTRSVGRGAIDEGKVKSSDIGCVVFDESGDPPGRDGRYMVFLVCIAVGEEIATTRVGGCVLYELRLSEVLLNVRDSGKFTYEGCFGVADPEHVLEMGVGDIGENDPQPVMANEHPAGHRERMLAAAGRKTPPSTVNNELNQLRTKHRRRTVRLVGSLIPLWIPTPPFPLASPRVRERNDEHTGQT